MQTDVEQSRPALGLLDDPTVKQAGRYFLKAVLLVAALMLVGLTVPRLPAPCIPVILMAFALLSTCGALYYTVVGRLHKQYKLAAGGQLSHINRRWTWKLVGFLVLFLFSGFFFLLEAPKWDALEWALTWVAIPTYYGVFLLTQRYLKKEFAPAFYKANAMKWSFWIVGVLLCLVYAVLSLALPSVEYAGLADAFQQTAKPYAASPSALMNEVDKLVSLPDGITAFGIAQAAGISWPVAFACKFAVYASVFFGLVNQFGFCLLDADEVRSEFRILPSPDEGAADGNGRHGRPSDAPVRRAYFVAVAVVFVVASALFLTLEAVMAKAQASQEHTAIESFVNEQMDALVYMVDGAYVQTREWAENRDDYARQLAELRDERNEALTPLVDAYYERCRGNVDSYLEWYYGIAGGWAKFLKPFGNLGGDDAVKTFRERITQGADAGAIQEVYGSYQGRIDQLMKDASLLDLEDDLSRQLQAGEDAGGEPSGEDGNEPESGSEPESEHALDLWQPLSGWGSRSVVKDTLLNTDADVGREEMKEKLLALIEQARADTLAELQRDVFVPVVAG